MTQAGLFDRLPPFQRHSATSRMAAIHMLPKAGTKRRLVLDHLTSCGNYGATDEEGMEAIRMGGNTYRPRRVELEQAKLIKKSGGQRRTHSGELADVWIAVQI